MNWQRSYAKLQMCSSSSTVSNRRVFAHSDLTLYTLQQQTAGKKIICQAVQQLSLVTHQGGFCQLAPNPLPWQCTAESAEKPQRAINHACNPLQIPTTPSIVRAGKQSHVENGMCKGSCRLGRRTLDSATSGMPPIVITLR